MLTSLIILSLVLFITLIEHQVLVLQIEIHPSELNLLSLFNKKIRSRLFSDCCLIILEDDSFDSLRG